MNADPINVPDNAIAVTCAKTLPTGARIAKVRMVMDLDVYVPVDGSIPVPRGKGGFPIVAQTDLITFALLRWRAMGCPNYQAFRVTDGVPEKA